jgi:hypothetical protein
MHERHSAQSAALSAFSVPNQATPGRSSLVGEHDVPCQFYCAQGVRCFFRLVSTPTLDSVCWVASFLVVQANEVYSGFPVAGATVDASDEWIDTVPANADNAVSTRFEHRTNGTQPWSSVSFALTYPLTWCTRSPGASRSSGHLHIHRGDLLISYPTQPSGREEGWPCDRCFGCALLNSDHSQTQPIVGFAHRRVCAMLLALGDVGPRRQQSETFEGFSRRQSEAFEGFNRRQSEAFEGFDVVLTAEGSGTTPAALGSLGRQVSHLPKCNFPSSCLELTTFRPPTYGN